MRTLPPPKPKTHTLVCQGCGAAVDFNKDDILTLTDWSGAFHDIYKKSVRCPLCLHRNIYETKDIDGTVYKRIEVLPL